MIKLVCLDRDGTINEDNNYFLGSSSDWKNKVKILPRVVEGIKRLNSMPDTEIFIVTNQSGVALLGNRFEELTEERMHDVNKYILEKLTKEGARIKGYFACPFVDSKYAEKVVERGWNIDPKYIQDEHPDLKPRTGLVEKCAASLGCSLKEVSLYVIGDRCTEVQLALNSGGIGILVAGKKTIELGDVEKVNKLKQDFPSRVFIASDFLQAVKYVK